LEELCAPLERANLPPDLKWRQFASTLPYIVGPDKNAFLSFCINAIMSCLLPTSMLTGTNQQKMQTFTIPVGSY